nr:PepSY domain-containing protein [Halomonas sp.]
MEAPMRAPISMLKKALVVPACLAMFAAGSAQADYLPIDRIDDVLNTAASYGFTHYEEIEIKSRERAEVEGWLDDEWYADVEFALDSGETVKEERKRLITGAWGMSEEDVRQALAVAQAEGMTDFEQIDIDKSGMIEVEGRDQDGRELEIKLRQGSDQASTIERD